MNKTRDNSIDALRGIAVIAMVIAHTNAYFLGNPVAVTLWDLSLFSVPTFIFCSAYLFFKQAQKREPLYDLTYFKKRILRLLIPYYIFLFIYFAFSVFLVKEPLSVKAIIENVTLTGGIGFNWLVILFIYFAILMPLLDILSRKKRTFFYFYCFSSFVVSVILLFIKIPIHFKLMMWLPWSLVIIATWFLAQKEEKQSTIFSWTAIWGVLFTFSLSAQYLLGHSLRHYENKYPPNLYHLAYGIAITFLLFFIARTKLFDRIKIQPALTFFSVNSYSFYFVHIIVLQIVPRFIDHTKLGWQLFFLVIIAVSTICQYVLNRLLLMLQTKKNN